MKWRVAVDRAVAPLGLTHAQYALWPRCTACSAPGCAPASAGSPTTPVWRRCTSPLARGLESAGLLERTRDPDDPRAVQLALTAQGRETTRQAIDVVQGLLRQLLAPLGGPDSPRAREFTRDLATLLDAPLDPFGTTDHATEQP